MLRRTAIAAMLPALALGFLIHATSYAQGRSPAPQAHRTVTGVIASVLDTSQLAQQIDDRFAFHPIRPENPLARPKMGRDNGLRAGQVRDVPRGELAGKWPAIGPTGSTPPDPMLAVGPSHVIATVNSSIAFFDRAGNKQFQQPAETFFSGMGVA